MLTARTWWCVGRVFRSLYEELASSFSERVFGRRIRTKGEREARMAELSEFDMALSRMMDRRVIGFPGLVILFASDASEDSELAATTAVALAKVTGSELHVLHVAPAFPDYFEPSDPDEPGPTEREGRRILDEQVNKIENVGGTVAQSHLRMGGAAEEVIDLAEELETGLIVLGSRGRGRIRRALMGSVSDSIVRHAHC